MRVDRYTKECERRLGVGMIEQSLCHHLQTQLTEYYKLIAVLESQMSMGRDCTQHCEHPISEHDPAGKEETGLTLRRLDVWINEWRLRMRMMSVCVEGARGNIPFLTYTKQSYFSSIGAQGGALVNLIHGYTDNGDPFVRKFTDQLLEEVNSLYIRRSALNLMRLPRSPNHSSPHYIGGSFQENFMTLTRNSS